ncbi:MAG: hypothetical protein LLG97_19550 [Deltaproteobacteria bacterium]|nr:hypothetical protein [Deltaproteobacteria bacterium]
MAKFTIIIQDCVDALGAPVIRFQWRRTGRLPKTRKSAAHCLAIHYANEFKSKKTLGRIMRKMGVI